MADISPPQTQVPSGIALALSGGGYRAMLFHTGALIRLNEMGLLSEVTRVSSVSGGSLTAARLGLVWRQLSWKDGVATNLDELCIQPILAFSRQTIDIVCGIVGAFTQGYAVWPVLAHYYDRGLFGGATLQALPADDEGPRFIICAANLTTGSLWRFSRPYMADYRVGKVDCPTVSLARAVAASSAFPPLLSPARLDLTKYALTQWPVTEDRSVVPPPLPDYVRKRAVLTDGGVYDNHGLEPVDKWPVLLVSDGGAPHAMAGSSYWNWYLQVRRVLDVEDNQVRSLRRRHLIESFNSKQKQGTYWSIATNPEIYADMGGLDCPMTATQQLAAVPTRLKDFGDPVRNALVNWGYALCDKSIRRWYRPGLPAASSWPMSGGLGI
ncbi:MAG TPA: patatin-like phospholipase family protein [Reyranella sp.]|nr:patatin-like phospholipase family protein [Reyranella sp.]